MQLKNYNHTGGKHWQSTIVKNVLDYYGTKNPFSGEPFSEAFCFGLGGGIAAGYAFCPSVPGYDIGSGASVAGRYRMYRTDAGYYADFFQRIGGKMDMRETGGTKTALKNALDGLNEQKPVIVWASMTNHPFLCWANCTGMCTLLVVGINEDQQVATVCDHTSSPRPMTLDDLETTRAQVCSHKNRSMTVDLPKTLKKSELQAAVRDAITACADDFLTPKLKTYSLPGLLGWSKEIASPKNKRSWVQMYPKGRLYLALRDVYDSIETSATGGSLFRPMYAAFLQEAAEYTKSKALNVCAENYRQLASQWSAFADSILPDSIAPFKKTKQLLQKRGNALEKKANAAIREFQKTGEEIHSIEASMKEKFPLSDDQSLDLLQSMSVEIRKLHDLELRAAKELLSTIQ